jgi:3-oxoacyl-[acyl-carrier-protein] synthase III
MPEQSKPPEMTIIQIAGTGSRVPEHTITTDALGTFIERYVPGKGAPWAYQKLGITDRRFVAALDPKTGHPVETSDEIDLAAQAGRAAIDNAGLSAEDVGGLWYVSCTQSEPRRHFSRSAFDLHSRLGLRSDAFALEMDAGCGGGVQAIAAASYLLRGGCADNVLVVAANVPSQYFGNWEAYARTGAWLSMYIFGDGAGAVLLCRGTSSSKPTGILATYMAVDPLMPLMEYVRHEGETEAVYAIDGRGVALGFRRYARMAIEELQRRHPFRLDEVRRFYFHQVNGHVLRNFIAEMAIPEDRTAIHIERYGNLAAAATLVLLDEDRRAGLVGPGDLCLFCAVGAGAQYGALLVRL